MQAHPPPSPPPPLAMLVPRFSLQQTPNTVIVTIKLPYIRVGDAEVSADGRDFVFYCRPYLLKLQFPHALKNNEDEESHCRAVYDANLVSGAGLPSPCTGR
ncbi:shq1 like protein [Nannochloropsis gaditana]|uniref:Shq1 like protein n=1 Tax=Nannochloropsis gaditana TaxID=72520 RepID=W7TGN8_9STRA|nr:shq1 like protein [Nannochloropsis gaditana]